MRKDRDTRGTEEKWYVDEKYNLSSDTSKRDPWLNGTDEEKWYVDEK
jgi:hypothetical protein